VPWVRGDMRIRGLRDTVGAERAEREEWAKLHRVACLTPRPGPERALVCVAAGITEYAQHMAADGPVFDGVLSPAIGDMLQGFQELLNGERGRLGGGTCDTWARNIADAVEWDMDSMEPSRDEPEEESTYKIVRMYRDGHDNETIATGVSLAEAQEHCNDPESSSASATGAEGTKRTAEYGPWFHGFEEE